MKKNSKPELTPSWWNSNKPKAWSDVRLEMALSAYAKGLSRLEREKSEDAFESASNLLDQVEKQAAASEKVAGEKPKKEPKDYDAEDFKNTAEVLKKFGGCVTVERKKLQDLVEEQDGAEEADDEEEVDKGLLLDEDAYKKYLKKMMKKLQSKAYSFAFALAKPSSPEEHRFLFHKSKDGKKLGREIVDEVEWLEMKKLTWGTANADPQASSTLVLMLEHKQIPGMEKQGNKFLKAFKPLPFELIKLVSAETGEVLQDILDPEDTETGETGVAAGTAPAPPGPTYIPEPDLLARLTALTPRIKEFAAAADAAGQAAGADLEAKKAALVPRNRLLTLVRDCKGMIGKNDEQAEAMLADIEGILQAGPGDVSTSATTSTAKPNLLARLTALTPRIKEFAAAADAAGQAAGADLEAKKAALAPRNRLLTLVRDCKGMIGKNDQQAEAMLAEIEGILQAGPGSDEVTSSSENFADRFKARLASLIPQIKQAAGTAAGDAAKLKASEAGVFARKQDFTHANLLLGQAEEALQASVVGKGVDDSEPLAGPDQPASSTSAAGQSESHTANDSGVSRLVKQRQFMLTRWARIPAELKVALVQYKNLMIDENADPDPEGLYAAMEKYLDALLTIIQEEFDDAINTGDSSVFAELRSRVASDELLVHLQSAPDMDGSQFMDAILSAMDEIAVAMAS